MNEKNRLHKPARVYQMHFAADFFTKDYKIKTLWLLPKNFFILPSAQEPKQVCSRARRL